MSDKERKDFIKLLILKKKKLAKDKKASRKFFIKAGIMTESGNLSKKYLR
jgi:hypothetical protein